MNRPKTRILVDGGDPQETRQIKKLLGFVDGQTTNPSLIANNPEIKQRLAAGHKLSETEEMEGYKQTVREISPLVGDAGVSIEVFSDRKTKEEMVAQGKAMYSRIPNAYIKYPCTSEGLPAAQMSVQDGLRVNLTLCFSQQQAAAVYSATKGARAPAYVSPFVGRLDDIGKNGMDLIKNVKRMFAESDGHVLLLTASIRTLEHLLSCFSLEANLVTVPAKILTLWGEKGFPLPATGTEYQFPGKAISYEKTGSGSTLGEFRHSARTDSQRPRKVCRRLSEDSCRIGTQFLVNSNRAFGIKEEEGEGTVSNTAA